MPLDEGIALMKAGFKEINTRFLVGGATFTLKVSPSRLSIVSGVVASSRRPAPTFVYV